MTIKVKLDLFFNTSTEDFKNVLFKIRKHEIIIIDLNYNIQFYIINLSSVEGNSKQNNERDRIHILMY